MNESRDMFRDTDEDSVPSPVRERVVRAITSLQDIDPVDTVQSQWLQETPSRPTIKMAIKLPNPVTKCIDCGKFVKQSVLKEHKLEHLKGQSHEQEQEIGLVIPSRPNPPSG